MGVEKIMYTPEQQEALDRMREYLQSATPEQLQADLERVAVWSYVGPTWDEYVSGLSNMLAQRRKPMNRIYETIRLNEWKIQQLPYFHVGDHISFDDLSRKIVKVVKGIKQPALSFNEYDVWKVNNEDINENNDYYYLLEPDDSNLEFSNPYYELNIVWASESYIKKYKDISEIQRMQQLAGLNEWKINKPLYKIGQKLEMQWDQDNVYTIAEIVKGEAIANRIGIEKETIYYSTDSTENQNPDEEEKKGYYYKLKSVHLLPLQYYLQHPRMIWVSEKWIEKWIRKILNVTQH